MGTYQGQKVKSRPAKQGDDGFNKSLGEQLVITLPDGSERTVPKAEVVED
jgi:hypothetical protein